jgi:putative effector of murein hydrolase
VFVIMTGIMAAMFSGWIFDWLGVRDWAARGVAAGVAGHGIATAQILSVDQNAGAFAGLSIGLTGLFTALLLPLATQLLPLVVRVN